MAGTATTRAEAVQGTIVFTDIVGFTEFTATRGDVEALRLLATQDRLLSAAMSDEARVVKELGDGLLLWFPEPVTALHTVFALHRGFGDESAASGLALGIRVGTHHGKALQRGEDIIGHDVNIAARIVDLAAPGEVLVSDAVRVVVDSDAAHVRFSELGPVVMKGVPRPIRLWRANAT
jgi:class 3 adenylate cyclase